MPGRVPVPLTSFICWGKHLPGLAKEHRARCRVEVGTQVDQTQSCHPEIPQERCKGDAGDGKTTESTVRGGT